MVSSKLNFVLKLFSLMILVTLSYSKYQNSSQLNEEIIGPLNSTDYSLLQNKFDGFKLYLNIDKKTEDNFLRSKNNHTDSLICKGCLFLFNHIHDFVFKYYGKIGLFELVEFLCNHFSGLSHPACEGYVNKYGHIMLDSIINHYLTGEYICTLAKKCTDDHFKVYEGEEYAKYLLSDKPINITHVEVDTKAKTLKILHITDIHTDLEYDEGSVGTCGDPFCCRNNSIAEKNTKSVGLAGKWGYVGKCDLPLRTLLNFIDMAVNEIKPDIIFWTGDNPSHDEWDADTEQEIFKITTLFTNILKEKFSNVSVYPSLGNHEKFPTDQFYPFDDVKERPLLKYFGDLWKSWLGEEAYNQFVHYGYYSKKHLDTNLRIISYNCLYCDIFNFYLIKNPTDPNKQIDWLEQTLRNAESNEEVVYLIGHIAAGDTSLLSQCVKRFKAITDRFSHVIRGQFAGHTHLDEIKVLKEYFNEDKVSGLVFIAPSMTTVFEIDSNTKLVKDYLQYRMNITQANLDNLNDPKWNISYRGSEFFNVKDLTDFEGVHQFVNSIYTDKVIYEKVCRAFFADGPQIEMYIYCRFIKNTFDEFFDCIGWRTWNSEDYAFKLFNILGGKWYKTLPEY